MNITRILAISGRLMRQLIRDKRASVLVIFAPLLIMSLLAVILKSDDNPPRVAIKAGIGNMMITDSMTSMLSKPDELGSGFIVETIPDGVSPERAIKSDIVDAVLIIPDEFINERADGKRSKLTLVLEGADPMQTASIFSRFRKTIPDTMGSVPKFLPADCDPHCVDTIPDGPPAIEIEKIYGKDIEDTIDFFIPVLPPFFVFFFVFLLSGLSFLRERVGGTAERLLASPLARSELVCGYVLGFFTPALIQAAIVILFAKFVLGGPWGGWIVVLTTFLLCLVAECLGVFVSAFARSEFQVFQFIPIIILPQLLVCGIVWPIKGFPDWLKIIAYCFPLTYAVEAVRDVALRGFGFMDVWHDLAVLTLFAIFSVTLAAFSVRRAV